MKLVMILLLDEVDQTYIFAVALAVALGADICEIYTDVDGVFTADPRIVPTAKRIPVIDYDSMLEMSSCGFSCACIALCRVCSAIWHASSC